jgi:hypothetical protein
MISIVNFVRGSALLFFALATIGGGTASSADAQVPGRANFGDKLSFQSSDKMDYAVTDDRQAFTLTFSALEATIGNQKSDPPLMSQVAAFVIPVDGKSIDATFVVSAVATTTEGTDATIMLVVNDKSTMMHFPPNSNAKDVVLQLRYRAKAVSDLRVAIFVLVERDQAHPGAGADLTVDALDGDMGSAKPHPARKKTH